MKFVTKLIQGLPDQKFRKNIRILQIKTKWSPQRLIKLRLHQWVFFFQFLIEKSRKLCWTVKEERCLLSNFSGNNLKWELWTRFKSMRNLKKVFLATSSHKFLRFRWTNRSQEFFLLFLEKFDFSPLHSWCISRGDDLQDFNFQWAGKFKNVYNRSLLIYWNWFKSVIS